MIFLWFFFLFILLFNNKKYTFCKYINQYYLTSIQSYMIWRCNYDKIILCIARFTYISCLISFISLDYAMFSDIIHSSNYSFPSKNILLSNSRCFLNGTHLNNTENGGVYKTALFTYFWSNLITIKEPIFVRRDENMCNQIKYW